MANLNFILQNIVIIFIFDSSDDCISVAHHWSVDWPRDNDVTHCRVLRRESHDVAGDYSTSEALKVHAENFVSTSSGSSKVIYFTSGPFLDSSSCSSSVFWWSLLVCELR